MNPSLMAKYAFLCCGLTVFISSSFTRAENAVLQDDPYAARKLFYEEQWQKKIEAALRYVEGAVVSVDVVLTTDLNKTVKTECVDGDPAAEFSVAKSRTKTESGGDEAGVAAKGLSRKSEDSSSESSEEEVFVKNRIPSSQIVTSTAGLVPTSVSVSISIPTSYYEAVFSCRQRRRSKEAGNSDVDQSQLNAIETEVNHKVCDAVEILLPNKGSRDSSVRVTSFDSLMDSATRGVSAQSKRAFFKGDIVTVVFASDISDKMPFLSKFSRAGFSDAPVFQIAAEVVNVQPNGSLDIEGQQFMQSDNEKRELTVRGVIRSDSFASDGVTVVTDKIAELEIDVRLLEDEAKKMGSSTPSPKR